MDDGKWQYFNQSLITVWVSDPQEVRPLVRPEFLGV